MLSSNHDQIARLLLLSMLRSLTLFGLHTFLRSIFNIYFTHGSKLANYYIGWILTSVSFERVPKECVQVTKKGRRDRHTRNGLSATFISLSLEMVVIVVLQHVWVINFMMSQMYLQALVSIIITKIYYGQKPTPLPQLLSDLVHAHKQHWRPVR